MNGGLSIHLRPWCSAANRISIVDNPRNKPKPTPPKNWNNKKIVNIKKDKKEEADKKDIINKNDKKIVVNKVEETQKEVANEEIKQHKEANQQDVEINDEKDTGNGQIERHREETDEVDQKNEDDNEAKGRITPFIKMFESGKNDGDKQEEKEVEEEAKVEPKKMKVKENDNEKKNKNDKKKESENHEETRWSVMSFIKLFESKEKKVEKKDGVEGKKRCRLNSFRKIIGNAKKEDKTEIKSEDDEDHEDKTHEDKSEVKKDVQNDDKVDDSSENRGTNDDKKEDDTKNNKKDDKNEEINKNSQNNDRNEDVDEDLNDKYCKEKDDKDKKDDINEDKDDIEDDEEEITTYLENYVKMLDTYCPDDEDEEEEEAETEKEEEVEVEEEEVETEKEEKEDEAKDNDQQLQQQEEEEQAEDNDDEVQQCEVEGKAEVEQEDTQHNLEEINNDNQTEIWNKIEPDFWRVNKGHVPVDAVIVGSDTRPLYIGKSLDWIGIVDKDISVCTHLTKSQYLETYFGGVTRYPANIAYENTLQYLCGFGFKWASAKGLKRIPKILQKAYKEVINDKEYYIVAARSKQNLFNGRWFISTPECKLFIENKLIETPFKNSTMCIFSNEIEAEILMYVEDLSGVIFKGNDSSQKPGKRKFYVFADGKIY